MKLEQRKAELEKEFNTLDKEEEKLVDEGRELNKRLSEIRAKKLHLQGSFQEVDRLIKEEK